MIGTEPESPRPSEAEFRDMVRSWLEQHLPPREAAEPATLMGAGGGEDVLEEGRSFLELMSTQGWSVPTWPVEFGGAGLTADYERIISEELDCFQTPDLYMYNVGIRQAGSTLLQYASHGQKERWLPRISSGTDIWCLLFSEPSAGSDLAGLSTRADRDGSVWRVTGQKVWVSRAHHADWGLLLARTDPTVDKHSGITAFAVDMSSPGIEVRPLRQMNGDDHFNEVFLDDVEIPDRDRIGDEGQGWRVGVTTLMLERSKVSGAVRSGDSIDESSVLTLVRECGVLDDAVVRQRVAQIVIEIRIKERTAHRARALRSAGEEAGPEGSGDKLRRSRILKMIADLALGVQGMGSLVGENEWQTLFLTVPSISIRGGTDEIQRNIIGERVLGLPREPRIDKGVPFRELQSQ